MKPLPVAFPWTDIQVAEVAEALAEAVPMGVFYGREKMEDLARIALTAAARVMWMESRPDPMGAPRGYGWREARGVTGWFTVAPDGTWKWPGDSVTHE